MSPPSSGAAAPLSRAAATRHILTTVVFTFICYLSIGMPLAVLPGFVHTDLGFGAVLAGLAISVQYIATVFSRPLAGRQSDSAGPKWTVSTGLRVLALGGLLTAFAAWLADWPWLSLAVLAVARLGIGFSESWCTTGSNTWGIAQVGSANTARVISWNGIATFSGLAIGAPLGVVINDLGGLAAIGLFTALIAAAGALLAHYKPATPVLGGRAELAFRRVLRRVAPHGLGLALGAVGFGALASFIALYYDDRGWFHPAYALTSFGACFVLTRLVLANTIGRFGGLRVSVVSLLVEVVGLAMLWLAPSPGVAFAGAGLAGAGFALVFPALAVEAVKLVPANQRGSALGAYSLFLDLALCGVGPAAGWIAKHQGYPQIFLAAMACSGAGAALVAVMHLQARRPPPAAQQPAAPAGH